jgi:hypothetical protein
MAYGLQIDGFDFTYGTYSVVQKGTLGYLNTVINKADHPDITIWKVFFVPIGVRDITKNEVRPTYVETGTTITLKDTSDPTTYLYFVLGR